MLGPYFSTTYFNKMELLVFEYGIRAVMCRWDTLLKQSITGQIRVNYNLTFRMCTFNVISRLMYGQEIAALDACNSDLSLKWMSESTMYLFVRALMMLVRLKPVLYIAALMWDHRFKPFLNHIHNLIAERKRLLATVDKKDEQPVDLLQALIDCEDPESKVWLTGNQIHTEATMQMIAAVNTSAYTLTWTTHLFMLYPECYQWVVHEVRTQFPLSDTEAVPEIMYTMAKMSLPYLEACLHESMRMMPIIQAMLPRVVPEEGTTIKGHFLPGGTTVFCNVPGTHLNPKYWQDPHCFNPERFLDPATRHKAINSVFTFGHGSRICMGKHLAWIELLTIMANLLRHYDFKMPDNYTRTGPNIIDPATGHPKLMEKTEFMSARPAYYEKDCVIMVSPAKLD
ncbi:hypothetical protein IWW50_000948 [Coemansia erecta]|nr:hypothetical protein IWW50_000948 [Coemansia erecta]